MTVHFIYVHGDPVDSTMAIAHEVVARLRTRFDVVIHHPNAAITIDPAPGDILIGHPNRYGDCAFRRSFARPGWARRIVFAPFSYGMPKDAALIDDLVVAADFYLALTGPGWWAGIDASPFSHWRYKILPFELGINRGYFPPIRTRFNPPGQRRFLYIGNADAMRGGDYLAALADANPGLHFGWLRTGDGRHCLDTSEERDTAAIRKRMIGSKLHTHSIVNWRRPEGLKVIATYDFFIACGRSDAMPCEVLECTAWGLVPVSTPQCGYLANGWMTHIPSDRIAEASAILQDMNTWPDAAVRERQAAGWRALDTRYTWDRAAAQLLHAIEAPIPPMPTDREWRVRMRRNRTTLRRFLLRDRLSDQVHIAQSLARRAIQRVSYAH